MILIPEAEMVLRLFISALLGFMIGLERAFKGQPAGERTHALVAVASAAFAIISVHAFSDMFDAARVAAGVVTGLGFLGAGMILKEGNHEIHGLTTAAGGWAVGAVGLAIGSGLYLLGFCTLLWTPERRIPHRLVRSQKCKEMVKRLAALKKRGSFGVGPGCIKHLSDLPVRITERRIQLL